MNHLPLTWPAGQAAPQPAPAPAAPAPPEMTVGPDGRIAGLDGVLDQIGEALSRQITPIVRDTALPILQRDKELQRTIGESAGRAAANELKPVLWAAVAVGAVAVYLAWRRAR